MTSNARNKPRRENHIAKIRRENGLSQSALAVLVGVSQNTIGNIKRGTQSTTVDLALKIALILNVSLDELFRISKPQSEREAELDSPMSH
ncbi:MAG: helix-turn-helix transcriptional regulator [Pseudomonadota bacterium]